MPDAGIYDIGEGVILQATFTVGGVLTNPGAVTLKVEKPDGTVSTVSASSSSTGVYTGTFVPTMAGDHFYRFAGTAPAVGVEQGMFVVRVQRAV
jgi:hypothetical protein